MHQIALRDPAADDILDTSELLVGSQAYDCVTPAASFTVLRSTRFTSLLARGWSHSVAGPMPLQYQGILAEHRAVREGAGLFDLSHMGRLRF